MGMILISIQVSVRWSKLVGLEDPESHWIQVRKVQKMWKDRPHSKEMSHKGVDTPCYLS